MSDYAAFLASKALRVDPVGISAHRAVIPARAFDWQAYVIRWAVERGRAALFLDTGLGKTLIQLAWADSIAKATGGRVLILSPLAVAAQTVREAAVCGIAAEQVRTAEDVHTASARVLVCNYERLHHIDATAFVGVVLDESSILKSYMGATKRLLVDTFAAHRYKLCCTATPAPNDFMEFGNHCEFLGVLSSTLMLSRFFIADTSQTGTYRLKGHAEAAFWRWMTSWAIAMRTPADLIGPGGHPYTADGYVLPPLDIVTHRVTVDHEARQGETGELFRHGNLSATTLHREMRETANDRALEVATIVNREPSEPWVIWCHTDYEAAAVRAVLPSVVEVHGRLTIDEKESRLNAFSEGRTRVLLTKPSIAGFGLNWQHCARMAFVGLSYSYESLYQALRRCYRFGQQRSVIAHLVYAESEGGVRDTLTRKQEQHDMMQSKMIAAMAASQGTATTPDAVGVGIGDVRHGDGWTVTNGDCVDAWRGMPDESVDFSIYSPPFANLYVYTDDPRDMGNTSDDAEFFAHYEFLLAEMYRTTKFGRLMAVHCKQLPKYAGRDGRAGFRDFRGDIIRAAERHGWQLHSEVTIWKDPVIEMQRTKANGLLYKTLRRDASFTRTGMAEYVEVFRKWSRTDEESERETPIVHDREHFPLDWWQKAASPVWWDIEQTRVLNVRIARSEQDEKHICPLQLDVIERAVGLWSNPGDVVASPFTGIGSEGVVALQMGRKFVGAELKPEYFRFAVENLQAAVAQQDLFDLRVPA